MNPFNTRINPLAALETLAAIDPMLALEALDAILPTTEEAIELQRAQIGRSLQNLGELYKIQATEAIRENSFGAARRAISNAEETQSLASDFVY